ncbi:MAG: flagellar brake protein [Nitrosomonas sp.]|nr:MAG: flagellar brake protein [Nitrosomonas sp.]
MLAKLPKEVEVNKNSFPVSLIGYVKAVTLIVSMPASSDHYAGDPILEGDQLLIRLFSGQSAYSFIAYVDKIIKLPFKYVHLSYPNAISMQSVRKSRRIRCCIPGNIQGNSEMTDIGLLIVDISTSGAGIESKIPIGSLGTEVILVFTAIVFDEEISLTLKAIIKSAKRTFNHPERIILSGIEFINLGKKELTVLRHLIYQEIVERPEHSL